MILIKEYFFRKKIKDGVKLKKWGDPATISYNDCPVCLVQGIESIPKKKGEDESIWRKRKRYNYNSQDSFDFEPVLFHDIKYLGFCPMHRRIRVVENVCHMAECKYAKSHYFNMYCNRETRSDAITLAHNHFKSEFMSKLCVKYFVPDPVNGNYLSIH